MKRGWKFAIVIVLFLLSILGKALMIYELYSNDDLWLNVIQGVYYISLENLIYIADASLAILFFGLCMRDRKEFPITFATAIISTILYMVYMMALNYTWQWLEWNGFWNWAEPVYSPLDFATWGLRSYFSTGHPRYYLATGGYFVAVLIYQYRHTILRVCKNIRLCKTEKRE